jgi:type IV secretory pathway component VirB8
MVLSSYAVKRYIRQSNRWEYISYYDDNSNFRGNSIFSTKNEAQKYLEIYQKRMDQRINVYGKQMTQTTNGKLRLKIFDVKEDDEKYNKK